VTATSSHPSSHVEELPVSTEPHADRHPSPAPDWPPRFPHDAIDVLLRRVERAEEADTASAVALLTQVAREAQRLRATVVRLSAARLSAAEREARVIVAEAQQRADELRALALETLTRRLDEAEMLTAAVRAMIAVERDALGTRGAESTCPEQEERS